MYFRCSNIRGNFVGAKFWYGTFLLIAKQMYSITTLLWMMDISVTIRQNALHKADILLLQQVASTRPKERKKAERLRLNSTYFIIWFPNLGERLLNTTHFICCLNGRKLIILFLFIWMEKLFDILFSGQKKGLLILFFNYISLPDWKFQFWLHYTSFISLHQAEHSWVFSVPFSCTS